MGCCGAKANAEIMTEVAITSKPHEIVQATPLDNHVISSASSPLDDHVISSASPEYIKHFIKQKFANTSTTTDSCACYATCDATVGDSCSYCCGSGVEQLSCICYATCDETVGDSCGACCGSRAAKELIAVI